MPSSAIDSNTARYWGIVPAAGIGMRMSAERPKQYMPIGDKTLLEHVLERLLQLPWLAGLVVALHPEDRYWAQLAVSTDTRIRVVDGGEDRSRSVLNALNFLTLQASANDWVLVHDAARPCVTRESVESLRRHGSEHEAGAILGVPVSDTLKHVDGQLIQNTQNRASLWQAQTPQLFRYPLLHQSLARALAQGELVTDEASAMELAGHQPLIVEGRTDNIKVTRPEDLELAALILQQQAHLPQ